MNGKLYIVATPIGNMDDITLRALDVLKSADIIFAESPRHSERLLSHYKIEKKIYSYNDYNSHNMIEKALERIEQGSSIALITDAGTPTIQDPGYRLVKALREQFIDVVAVPGASALIAALSVSGLPTDRFIFLGFLPKGPIKKVNILKKFDLDATIILYESPNRLIRTLIAIENAFGKDRFIVVEREITKVYEEYISGSVCDVISQIEAKESIKGEFVILIRKSDV